MYLYKLAKPNYRGGDLSKQWYVEFQYIDPSTNKFKRFREYISNSIKTKSGRFAESQVIIKKLNNKLQAGWTPYDEDEKFIKLVDAFSEMVQIKSRNTAFYRTKETYFGYQRLFKSFLTTKNLLNINLVQFDFQNALAFMDYCIIEKKYSAYSFNNVLNGIRAIFNLMVKRDLIEVNHFSKIEKMPITEPDLLTYSISDLNIIKENLPGIDAGLYLFAKLIFHQYVRLSELCRLQIKDFDLNKKALRIQAGKGKNKKTKVLPLYDDIVKLLTHHGIKYLDPEYYVFSKNLMPGQIPIRPQRIHERWAEFCKNHKIKNMGIYKLKHTGNGMSLDNGADIYDIFLMNRHSDLDMTRKYIEKHRKTIPDERLSKFASFGT